mgnify:CR=1 FL=1
MVLFKLTQIDAITSQLNNLHSTMVLFKSLSTYIVISQKKIYIPLWSYSNRGIISSFFSVNNIYIPLWSYSNRKRTVRIIIFQLIYIPLWSYSNRLVMILIFMLSNLHSTMVLFKCFLVFKIYSKNVIYIPLWSYSNPLLLQYNNSLIKATTFVNPQHFHLDNSFFS